MVGVLLLLGLAGPDQPEPARGLAERGAALYQAAERSGRVSDYAAAEGVLRRAHAADPTRVDVVHALASVHGRTGRQEEAAQLLLAGLERTPREARLHAKLGYVHRYAGLGEASVAAYRRAQALDLSHANLIDTEDQIAKALIYAGDDAGARAAHARMRNLLRERGQAGDEKMLFYEGMAHLYGGREAEAVRSFDAAAALRPDSLWSDFALAYKAALTGDVADLRARAERLERASVADGERRYRLVHLYAQTGEPDRALRHLAGAFDAGFFDAGYMARDRLLQGLRAAPAFQAQVSRARLRQQAFAARFTSQDTTGARNSP